MDASAILAVLNDESGADIVLAALDRSVISSVTLTEVAAKLADGGADESSVRRTVGKLGMRVSAFDEDQAYRAGMMRPVTRNLGLSLGDKACLALAQSTALSVLTADRMWARVPINIEIQLIR